MTETHVNLSTASIVRICFDRLEKYDWEGRLYTRYRAEPFSFHNMNELMEIMEQFYDWLNYPQTSTASRSFRSEIPGRKRKKGAVQPVHSRVEKKGEQAVVVDENEMERKRGEKATFIVRVQYRQNATWQGQETWAEKNKTIPFRSALELLKLIDSTEEIRSNVWEPPEDKV